MRLFQLNETAFFIFFKVTDSIVCGEMCNAFLLKSEQTSWLGLF